MSNFDNTGQGPVTGRGAVPVQEGSVSAFRTGTDTSALRALQTIVEPGTLIDGYKLGKLIGRGTVAAVYEAVDVASGQPVAMKILDARLMADGRMVERFLKEGASLARFKHDNIVSYIAHGTDDTFAYVVMELVSGITLEQLIHSITIEPHHVAHLAREIGKALTTIHAAGMIHGDVKPSNVLVTRSGEVKLADFGTLTAPQASRPAATKVTGTLPYMAPELLEAQKPVDYRADIYALGVTFYKVLTKKLPESPVQSAAELVPELPPGVDGVLERAMQQEADLRFTTAKEFCDAMARLFDENSLATPVSNPAVTLDRLSPYAGSPATASAAKGASGAGIDWKMVVLCGLAAIGLAATLLVLAVYFGRW